MANNKEYNKIPAIDFLRWFKKAELSEELQAIYGENCTDMDEIMGMYTCEEIIDMAADNIRAAAKEKRNPMDDILICQTVNEVYGGDLWQIRHTHPNASEFAPEVVQTFLDKVSKSDDNWTLSIYNFHKEVSAEIDCKPSQFAEVVAKVCKLEGVATMSFVGDCPPVRTVVVGLGCKEKFMKFPGWYIYTDGKIKQLELQN